MKIKFLVLGALVGAFLASPALATIFPAGAFPIQDWQFTEPDGTPITGVANSVPSGAAFNFDIDNSFTTGNGTFKVARQDGGLQQISYAELTNAPATGNLWAVIDIVGWDYDSVFPRFTAGFYDVAGAANSTNTANLTSRVDFRPGDYDTNPNNAGVGGFATGAGVSIGYESTESWGPVSDASNSPVRLVLEQRQDTNAYEVFYSFDNVNYTSIGSQVTDPARGANFFALGTINNFLGDGLEISRVQILAIPEPSSVVLLSMAMVGLLGVARRTRS